MNHLCEKVESVEEDVKPETYKDYKNLKKDIKTQKEESLVLHKELAKVFNENQTQRQKISVYSDRIRTMEEMVGMIADNEEYRNMELQAEDNLYEESQMRPSMMIEAEMMV